MLYCSIIIINSLCRVSRAPPPVCNEQGFRGSSLKPCGWGVLGRLNPAGYLTKSSNLWKATMAPIRWDLGEKPLSMKSSVLCLSSSGLVTLMGTVILQGGWEVGGEVATCRSGRKSCSCPGSFGEPAPHQSLLKEGGLESEVESGRDPPLAMHRAPGAWPSVLLVSHLTSPMVTMHLVLQTQVWRVQSGSAGGAGGKMSPL